MRQKLKNNWRTTIVTGHEQLHLLGSQRFGKEGGVAVSDGPKPSIIALYAWPAWPAYTSAAASYRQVRSTSADRTQFDISISKRNSCNEPGKRASDVIDYTKKMTVNYFLTKKIKSEISKNHHHFSYIPSPHFSPVQQLLALALLPPLPKSSHSNPSISCTLQIVIMIYRSW